MTVAELIEKLKEMPQDAVCYFEYDCGYACGSVDEVRYDENYNNETSVVVMS